MHRWLLSLPDKAAAVIGGENPLCKKPPTARRARRVPQLPRRTRPVNRHGSGAEHIALVLCFVTEKLCGAREGGERAARGGGRRPRVRSGRPCPYLGLPGGLAQGNRAAHLDTAKKQGGLGPRSAVAFRRGSPTDRSSRDHRAPPPKTRVGRRPPRGRPRQGRPVGFRRRCIPGRTHTHTLRGVPRPGRGSGPARAWGPGRAASRAARSRTAAEAAAARAARGRPAPG